MLLNHCDLALYIKEVVPDAKIERVRVLFAPFRNFLKLFTIQWVDHIDLKGDKHRWLVSQNSNFLDDTRPHVFSLSIGLAEYYTEDYVLSNVLLKGFGDHHCEF